MSEEVSDSREILKLSNISLWVNGYEDIFSDFDSRPFSERALSDDFLVEMKRASRDKPSGVIELKFMIPREKRNLANEHLIRRRLKDHFRKHYSIVHKEHSKIKKRGLYLIFLGIFMIALATYIGSLPLNSLLLHFLIVILEPGGWFTGWTGCDQFFYTLRKHRKELEFYDKMAKIEVQFISIQAD